MNRKSIILLYACLLLNVFSLSVGAQDFVEQTGIVLPAANLGSVDWGDFNNDGYLDILIAGTDDSNQQVGYIYKNNGDNTFTDQSSLFSPALQNYNSSDYITAKWVDFDNDGYLDIMFSGYGNVGENEISIYQNISGASFILQSKINFVSQFDYSSDAGDVDNDGDMDILFTENTESKIYINLNNFEFSELDKADLAGFYRSSCDIFDYDNDGDNDILLCGYSTPNTTKLYRNEGDGLFEEQTEINLGFSSNGSIDWGDYNNDGYADLLQTGNSTNVYVNNGNNTFSILADQTFSSISTGEGKWGDLDNDGDLDIILAGSNLAEIYLNNGNGNFTLATGTSIIQLSNTSIDLGDYDGDNDLDLLISGYQGPISYSKVYRNESTPVNDLPGTPSGMSSAMSGNDIILSWDSIENDNTASKNISYNISVGSSTGLSDIVHPSSSSDGTYRLSEMGNAQLDTTFVLNNLAKGFYYWKVQAIDNSFIGGAFSSEQSFNYTADYQSFGITTRSIDGTQASINWSRGNGDNCIVFAKEGTVSTALPIDNLTYTSSETFGAGTQIGTSGWYCIYNGPLNYTDIKGLSPNTDYMIQVQEYSNSPGNEIYNNMISESNTLSFKTGFLTALYNTGLSASNPESAYTSIRSECYWLDFDNDEDLDLLILRSTGNFLFSNDGSDNFTEVSQSFSYGYIGACSDYNNDGFIDIAINNGTNTFVYKNNGDNTFTEIAGTSIIGATGGSLDWGDFDNDGDADLILTGEIGSSGATTRIYKNNSDDTFTELANHNILSVRYGYSDWGDFNNDGYLDIVISGISPEGASSTSLYSNNKNSGFTLSQVLNDRRGMVEWGDYNQDGNLDLLFIGASYSNLVYLNDGDGNLILQDQISINSTLYGSGHWGDYDNDGDLDIFASGYSNGQYMRYASFFENMGDNSFIEDTLNRLIPAGNTSSAWGDYDKDGDLDLLHIGISTDSIITLLYKNEILNVNPSPQAVTGTDSEVTKSDVTLKWNSVKTDNTEKAGLSYNLKIGSISGEIDILSPNSASNGFRRLAEIGNANLDTSYYLSKVPFGTYYWSVQAIDNSFIGGPFSVEGSFSVVPVQATNLQAKIINNTSLQLNWERGNGTRCLVFCKETNTGSSSAIDNETYLPDSEFGYGQQLGTTGWYCVYNGRSDSTIITGLKYKIDYSFQVIEYTGEIGSEQYFNIAADGNPGVFSTGLFSEQSNIALSASINSEYAWGDYNNDGFMDVLIPGDPSKVFKNNGDNSFTENTFIILPNVQYGTCAWVDYDNDQDLDIFLSGTANGYPNYAPGFAGIFQNDGGGSFNQLTGLPFENVFFSAADWGDYDNDGDLDLLLNGATSGDPTYDPVSKVYKNNGDGTFTEETQISLTPMYRGSAKWVDYDGDGDLDIHISGMLDFDLDNTSNKIYKNNGDNSFSEQSQINLPGLYDSRVDWGDYDKDGDLDLVMTRKGYIYIYKNTGDDFIQIYSKFYGFASNGAVVWADYDNDGFLDILFGNFSAAAIIYKNMNGESFEIFDEASFKFTSVQGFETCDYDNDGDIDIMVYSTGENCKLYKNNLFMKSGAFAPNRMPDAPTGLNYTLAPEGVTLNWNHVLNDESPSQTLSYNVKLGSTSDSLDVSSPHSDSSGYRRVVSMGNASVDTSYFIRNLIPQKYYWRVQAVDNGFKGGKWSNLDSFEVKSLQPFFDFDTVCLGNTTSFSDKSIATDVITSWNWDFGDGGTSIEQNPNYIFTNSGINQVKLIVESSGFSDSITQNVYVNPRPSAAFITENICQGASASFTNSTNPDGATIANWYWDFGDGGTSINENPADYDYANIGDYDVKLAAYATNGCSDSIVNIVSVAAIPVSTISTLGNPEFCEGKFVKLSIPENSAYIYQWKISGVPISGADSSVYFATLSGNHTVTVTNPIANCISTSLTPVNVIAASAPSQPLIQASGPTTFCEGDSIELNVASITGYTYQWKLNGGAVGSNLNTYTAKSSGTYTIEVINSTGCNATSSNSIILTVNDKPLAPGVNLGSEATFCEGDSVVLSVTNITSLTYQWMDDAASISGDTTNRYVARTSGNYILRILNSNGCINSTNPVNVTVNPSPASPTISIDGNQVFCAGDSAILSVTDNPDLSYQWMLNEGTIGSDQNSYLAIASGNYTLEVTNSSLCNSFATNSVSITVNPAPTTPSISINGDTDFCSGDSAILSTSSNPALSYQWINGSSNIAQADTSIYSALSSGTYKLRITNENDCSSLSEVVAINVRQSPAPPTINYSGELEFCEGNPLILSATLNPANTYEWFYNNAGTGNVSETIEANQSGIYDIHVTNDDNCELTSINPLSIKVKPKPAMPTIIQVGNDIICEGEVLTLAVAEPGSDSYQWMESNNTIPGKTGSILSIDSSGLYNLRARNSDMCEVFTAVRRLTVNPQPSVPLIEVENYTEGDCKSVDPVNIRITNPETKTNYIWYDGNQIIQNETSTLLDNIEEGTFRVVAIINSCTSESVSTEISYPTMPEKPSIIAEGPNIWYLACNNENGTDYNWYFNGTEISGANNYVYIAGTKLGKYKVGVKENTNCYNFSDEIQIPLSTGIEDHPFSNLKIYPNPTPGLFTLEMDNAIMGELIIDIFGETGQQIINIKFQKETSHFKTQIDMSGQPAALYMINLMLDEWSITKSLVVE